MQRDAIAGGPPFDASMVRVVMIRQNMSRAADCYGNDCKHSSIGYRAPVQFETQLAGQN